MLRGAIVIALKRKCVRQNAKTARRKHGEKQAKERLCLGQLAQPANSTIVRSVNGEYARYVQYNTPPDCRSGSGGDCPCTARNDLLASLALPNSNGLTLDGVLLARI